VLDCPHAAGAHRLKLPGNLCDSEYELQSTIYRTTETTQNYGLRANAQIQRTSQFGGNQTTSTKLLVSARPHFQYSNETAQRQLAGDTAQPRTATPSALTISLRPAPSSADAHTTVANLAHAQAPAYVMRTHFHVTTASTVSGTATTCTTKACIWQAGYCRVRVSDNCVLAFSTPTTESQVSCEPALPQNAAAHQSPAPVRGGAASAAGPRTAA
jgi:hypothetical protein